MTWRGAPSGPEGPYAAEVRRPFPQPAIRAGYSGSGYPCLDAGAVGLYGLAMKSIGDSVASGRVLVSDGAWGTLLQRQGLQPGECPELWCLERRDSVLAVARGYVDAGADIILTDSFGANRFKLRHFGLDGRAAELNAAAAAISREAAGDSVHVAGSMGPTGKLLLMGDVTEEQLYEAFREQAAALEKGGADACCIETFAAIDEAMLAVRAALDNTSLEVICTFTFEKNVRNEYRTMMGVSPGEMAAALFGAGAHIVGANCGNGMAGMAEVVAEMRRHAPRAPILVHANAGMPVRRNGVDTYLETPAEMAGQVPRVLAAGANVVGGCCGTTPEHIRAIKETVERVMKEKR